LTGTIDLILADPEPMTSLQPFGQQLRVFLEPFAATFGL
jgi:hypothetical protein